VQLTINGLQRQVDEVHTVADLLAHLGLSDRHVAVEVNLDVVPKARHCEHRLRAGDRIEVVTLVGGG
jgi:sulfur carrier protein